MALSARDRAFYQERLGWKGFAYLFAVTVVMGGVLWPTMLFLQSHFDADKAPWNLKIAAALSLSGMLLGAVVALLMFLLARFYLHMGWLPRRR
jgi:hypothetical protein